MDIGAEAIIRVTDMVTDMATGTVTAMATDEVMLQVIIMETTTITTDTTTIEECKILPQEQIELITVTPEKLGLARNLIMFIQIKKVILTSKTKAAIGNSKIKNPLKAEEQADPIPVRNPTQDQVQGNSPMQNPVQSRVQGQVLNLVRDQVRGNSQVLDKAQVTLNSN